MRWKEYERHGHSSLWIVICALLLLAVESRAQQKYISQKLEHMATTLQSVHGVNCLEMPMWGDHALAVREDALQEVCHIGFRLFPQQIIEQNPSPVYNFVERYLLELALLKEDARILQALREDKVRLKIGSTLPSSNICSRLLSILPRVKSCPSFIITTDNQYYTASWSEGGSNLLYLRFPIQYELLWGMNKKEVESRFHQDLLYFQEAHRQDADTASEEEDAYWADYLTALNDSCYLLEGECYGVESMNSNRYYKKRADGRFTLLYDARYPEESVRNLFLSGQGKRVKVSVCQRLYGRKKQEFDTTLAQLMAFFKALGCTAYIGIESMEGYRATGGLTLLNPAAGYCHLLYFDMDLRTLIRPGDFTVKAELYGYVPTHNINNLFYENNNKKK
ncbi:MAG: hypothetical protein IJ511_04385 [Bacteroides sp.]|nr:hypothetical protein [Bacteroides sp.]